MMGGPMAEMMKNLPPEAQEACNVPIMTPMGMNWTALAPCMGAMTTTRPVCAQCFVNTIQDIVGKTMLQLPFSCAAKCMGEVSGPLKKIGPTCQGCLLPNMENMMVCI